MKKFLCLLIPICFYLQSCEKNIADKPETIDPVIITDDLPGSWKRVADIPGEQPLPIGNGYAFAIGNIGYMQPGYSRQVPQFVPRWEYDTVTDTWTRAFASGACCPAYQTTFLIGNRVYSGTGASPEQPLSNGDLFGENYFISFDPINYDPESLANFPITLIAGTGFGINGKGYMGIGLTGDVDTHWVPTSDFYEYNPQTDRWTKKAKYPGETTGNAVGFSIGGKGYVGTGGGPRNPPAAFWEYNPKTNCWTKKADFPGVALDGALAFTISDKAYVGSIGLSTDFYEYDPKENSWKQVESFPGRGGAFAFSTDHKGYLGGGSFRDLWQFDPEGN